MPVIEAHDVYKVFGRRPQRGVEAMKAGSSREDLRELGLTAAVVDASFEVERGEVFVVMGLSGSGKSTLIRMINGLIAPTSGTVRVDGKDVQGVDAASLRQVRREKVSMVFQNFALLPHRTVGQNAAYGLQLQGMNRSDREDAANKALNEVGLKGWGAYMPDELSGGMRQRVGLARALAAGTEVMLMDEAFSALDPLIRREMQDQLLDLQTRLEKTVLFITHDLNEAMRLGDRIAMMRDGKIEQIGSSEQILNDPANDYVAQFVQDVDRTKVLTVSAVMEKPVATLGSEQGPRTAHRLMRENQLSSLVIVDRSQNVQGIVYEDEVSQAVGRGQEDLTGVLRPAPTVRAEESLADIFAASAESSLLVVVDGNRLVGVVPRVTLLNALGSGAYAPADETDATKENA